MPQYPDAHRLFRQAQKLSLSAFGYLVAQLTSEVETRKAATESTEIWREEYCK